MYFNDKILIAKNDEKEIYLIPKMANRHGIITGASGSGKTITLKVLAESFSNAGVPVFMVDVKGDLAATCKPGVENPNVSMRVEQMGLENFTLRDFPVTFFDVYGEKGHPIRTTITNLGPRLLSRMLDLSDAQEGVLAIVFQIAEDEKLEIIDLKDLQKILTYVGEKKNEYSLKYGNISIQSIGSIQRNLLILEQEGGSYFFGKPEFNIRDFIRYNSADGYGYINILDAQELFKKPTLYATFLVWMLTEIYNTMPEVGDLVRPRLVLFIDEAHLLFSEMSSNVVKSIIQIVKLIRSKGVGVYFISQSPSDVPDEILSQLGNKVQHVLRAYTPSDEKAIKAAANSFRANPKFDTAEAIKELATGEALISTLDEKGEPSIVERAKILPPQSMMGPIDDGERRTQIFNSQLYMKYEELVDENSAYEKINKINEEKERERLEAEEAARKAKEEELAAIQKAKEEKEIARQEKEAARIREKEEREAARLKAQEEREAAKKAKEEEKAKKNSIGYKLGKKVANKTADKLINKGLNSLFKGLFK